MNIHEAISELKSGKLIARKGGEEFYFRVLIEGLKISLYSKRAISNVDDYWGFFWISPNFDLEEIEATDWEIFIPTPQQLSHLKWPEERLHLSSQ